MRNKLFSLLLVAAMALCLLTPAALASDNAYRVLYGGELTTLNYLITATTNEFALAANVIDTLIEYDRFGVIQPALATSWEVSDDGLVWTFYLREGVQWVDGKGEPVAEVTADDFVAAAKYILNAQNASSTAGILYGEALIAGAEEYYDGTSTPEEGEEPYPVMEWDTVGIKALDKYTLQYTLIDQVPFFLSMTTYVCFMPVYEPFLLEKGDGFGLATGNDTLLYCGAFYLSEFKPQEKRTYSRNPLNWDADNVFLDAIEFTFNKESATVAPELYLRGEVDETGIDTTIAMEWLKDPVKSELIRPVRNSGVIYSYFYSLNFDPQFDAIYEPDNWLLAVNNENFRKALYYGIDRVKTQQILDPENPEALVYNTVTPPGLANLDGLDFTVIGDLAAITAQGANTLDEEKALAYRDAAKAELEAEGATFPIKVLVSYNPNTNSWDEECQILEQQLEALLGSDFIDVVIEAGPSTGFLAAVRRSGMYSLLKCNWGPDYADPQTFVEPFSVGNNYNFIDKGWSQEDENGKLIDQYYALVDKAIAITKDFGARYEAFAKAEAFLINHSIIVPIGYGDGGYVGSRLNPFESQYASFGISDYRYKGQHLLEKPMSTDEYFEAYDLWLEERAALAD